MQLNTLPIPHQIEALKQYHANNEDAIRHYAKNPTQLDQLHFQIQTQKFQAKSTELFNKIKKLENL